MKLFFALSVIAFVLAQCPRERKIRSARILVGNIVNGINQRALGLLTNAIASSDATACANAKIDGCCQEFTNSFAFMASGAILSKEKFVSVNITDAYQAQVGYTVVHARVLSSKNKYSEHEFQFMDPKDNCALELIFWRVDEECCLDGKKRKEHVRAEI